MPSFPPTYEAFPVEEENCSAENGNPRFPTGKSAGKTVQRIENSKDITSLILGIPVASHLDQQAG
jgi:hypothetical protein